MCHSHASCFSFPVLLCSPDIASHLCLRFSSSFLPCFPATCVQLAPGQRGRVGAAVHGTGEGILHPASTHRARVCGRGRPPLA